MICVLLSTFNGENFLFEQLESLRKQEGVELKILVRDDGSTDSTLEIIKRWQTENPELIDLVEGKNVGFALSFSNLLQMARDKYPNAEYYAFCDQDDVWLPNKLYEAVTVLQKKVTQDSLTKPICYASNLIVVDEGLNIIKRSLYDEVDTLTKLQGLLSDYCTGCTMVFNKRSVELYLDYQHGFLRYHDKLLGMICLFLGELIYDSRSFINYRQHGNNQIGAHTSYIKIIINCIKRLFSNEEGYRRIFVLDFVETYKSLLSLHDLKMLLDISCYNTSIFSKISLLFDNGLNSVNLFLRIRIKLKILLNKL